MLQFVFDGLPGDRDSMDDEIWVTPKNSFSHLPSAAGGDGSNRRPPHTRCPKHAAAEYIATHLLHHNHHPSAVVPAASLHNQGATLHNHSQMGAPSDAAAAQHLLHHHHLHHSTHALHGPPTHLGAGGNVNPTGMTSKLTSAGGGAGVGVVNNSHNPHPQGLTSTNVVQVAPSAAAKKLYSLPEHATTHHSFHSVCFSILILLNYLLG